MVQGIVQRWGIIGLIGLIGCFAAPLPAATIYKCTHKGLTEYRDTPCHKGSQEIMTVQGDGSRKSRIGASLLDTGLRGVWCEYAIAATPDGQKDRSRRVIWSFGDDGFLDYMMQGSSEHIRTPYEIVEQEIQTKSGLIGAWGIASFESNEMLLTGPLGGYAFLQRGECPTVAEVKAN